MDWPGTCVAATYPWLDAAMGIVLSPYGAYLAVLLPIVFAKSLVRILVRTFLTAICTLNHTLDSACGTPSFCILNQRIISSGL